MLINSPEDYYAWVENENADEFSWLFDSLDEFEELNVNSKCTYEINTDAINAMIEENTGASLADSGVNLPNEISMEVKGADIDGVYTLNEVISSGDSPVLNYNLYFLFFRGNGYFRKNREQFVNN